jgi:fumarate reductase flavoprotein subunit
MVAALAANEAGQEVLVLERDAVPAGSTALSAGLIPAAGTRFQRDAGIDDDPEIFAADIQRKAHGENDPALVAALAPRRRPTIEWLADRHGLPFSGGHDFDYPGHSRRRMHGLPSRSGASWSTGCAPPAKREGIPTSCERRGHHAFAFADGRVAGVAVRGPTAASSGSAAGG